MEFTANDLVDDIPYVYSPSLGRYISREDQAIEERNRACEEAEKKMQEKEKVNAENAAIPSLKVLILEELLKNTKGYENRIVLFAAMCNLHIDDKDRRLVAVTNRCQALFNEIYPALEAKMGKDALAEIIGTERIALAEEQLVRHKVAKRNSAIATSGCIVMPTKVQLTEEELAVAAVACGGDGAGAGAVYYPIRALVRGVEWPEGVESSKRETYLSDEDFYTVFGMEKAAFQALDKYKRVGLKKAKDFF